MNDHEARKNLQRLFENPPEGITPGSEPDVQRFLRLGLFARSYAAALIQHGESTSIAEAITEV